MATTVYPKPFTLFFPKRITHRQDHQFFLTVCKPTLVTIVAISQLGEGLAELGLVLEGVGLHQVVLFIWF